MVNILDNKVISFRGFFCSFLGHFPAWDIFSEIICCNIEVIVLIWVVRTAQTLDFEIAEIHKTYLRSLFLPIMVSDFINLRFFLEIFVFGRGWRGGGHFLSKHNPLKQIRCDELSYSQCIVYLSAIVFLSSSHGQPFRSRFIHFVYNCY